MVKNFGKVQHNKRSKIRGNSSTFFWGRSVSASSYAVGLSAISLLAFVITSLAKDAAPIPNANATINKNANPDYKVNVFFSLKNIFC